MSKKNQCQTPQENGVVLLNKQFSGSWLDVDENIAHEIIDFLKADKTDKNGNNHFIYDAPHGTCPNVYVEGTKPVGSETLAAKYMILTGPATIHHEEVKDENGKPKLDKRNKPKRESKGCSFDIYYVIELKDKVNHFDSNFWKTTWKGVEQKQLQLPKGDWKTQTKNLFLELRDKFCPPGIKTPTPEKLYDDLSKGKLKNDVKEKLKVLIGKELGKLLKQDRYQQLELDEDQRDKIVDYVVGAREKYEAACYNHNQLVESTNDITFNGRTLTKIHAGEQGNDCSIYLTFSVKKMCRVDPPLHVTCQSFVHQRCRGRLTQSEHKDDYEKLSEIAKEIVGGVPANGKQLVRISVGPEDGKMECNAAKFSPRIVNWDRFAERSSGKTYLDLLGLQNYEQAYTNMLCLVLKVRKGAMLERFCEFVQKKHRTDCNKGRFRALHVWKHEDWNDCDIKVSCETIAEQSEVKNEEEEEYGKTDKETEKAQKNGRMDVCAEITERNTGHVVQRVIIENKIDSSLNGVVEGTDKVTISQLDTYYQKWGKRNENDPEPLCFVVAPTYREREIQKEINDIDNNASGKNVNGQQRKKGDAGKKKMGDIYLLVNYGEVAEFIERHKGMIPENEIPPAFVSEIIRSFQAHSLSLEDYYAWKVLLKSEQV